MLPPKLKHPTKSTKHDKAWKGSGLGVGDQIPLSVTILCDLEAVVSPLELSFLICKRRCNTACLADVVWGINVKNKHLVQGLVHMRGSVSI